MGRLAYICPHCHRIVPARQTCGCRPKRTQSEAERLARQPWRVVYKHSSWRRNRARRWEMSGHRCESCGRDIEGQPWECDHLTEARLFVRADGAVDVLAANAVDNLRVRCVPCHKAKTARG